MRPVLALASLLLIVPAAGAVQINQTQGQKPAVGGHVAPSSASMTPADKAAFAKQVTDTLLAASGRQGGSGAAAGVSQEVGQAVVAIVQGASDGDRRLQEVLNLLAAGNVVQATSLLQAFAAEKKAQIDRDIKEAATAYRSLGAIGGLQDPKEALEAYAKAAEFGPDDIESLYWAGYFETDHGDLSSAEGRLRQVLARTSGENPYHYWAQVRLSEIAMRRGDQAAALTGYQAALAIAERLVKGLSSNADSPPVPPEENKKGSPPPRPEQFIAQSIHAPLFARMSYKGFSRAEALAIAQQEWRLFGQLVDDDPPRNGPDPEAIDDPERSPGAWERIGEYWWLGQDADRRESTWTGMHDETGQEIEDGHDSDYAWSAAFISYVMRTAGAGGRFPYAPSHYIYIDTAKDMKLGRTSGWALTAERVDAYPPVPGDLICFWRGSKSLNFDDLPALRFAAHCDLVVSVSLERKQLSVIGGNVRHAVAMKHVPVTEDGRLAASPDGVLDARFPWFVVLHVLYDR